MFFLILSLLFVGVLFSLYSPLQIDASSFMKSQIISGESQMSGEVIVNDVTHDNTEKRIRLTQLLLRYQKQMSEIESIWDAMSSAEKQSKISSLSQKIESLQLRIEKLSR